MALGRAVRQSLAYCSFDLALSSQNATLCGGPDGPGAVVISCILGETRIEDTCGISDPSAVEESEERAGSLEPIAVAVGGLAVVGMGVAAAVARKKRRKSAGGGAAEFSSASAIIWCSRVALLCSTTRWPSC